MQNFFLVLFVFLISTHPKKSEEFKPVVVLELFTSQGCSSCPSADNLLKNVKTNHESSDVIALSYHVDYWNYIGWEDPFSKASYSDKQRVYSRKFNSSSIYTPQVVINGKAHFVGSNKGIMSNSLGTYLKVPSKNKVVIRDVKKDSKSIQFNYNIEGATANKKLRVVLVINERTTTVNRGENKNRVLKNANIVVAEQYLDIAASMGKAEMVIPDLVETEDNLSLVAIIETNNLDITGAFQTAL